MRNTWRPRKSPQLSQSLSGSDEGASEGSRRLARRRPSSYFRVALVFAVLLGVLLLIACFPGVRHPRPPQESVRIDPFVSQSKCNDVTLNDENYSGFSEEPVDSTVLMLYTPTSRSSSGFCYSDGVGGANTTVEQEFLRVAASYVASPYAKPSSPYYDFFRAHDATLWTVDRVARVATPMRLDIAYTYVNPSAPSFERHLKMRNVPFEQRRYRDWEELRYSLRSLRAFMLDNDALAQHHRRHAADVRRLGELGYRVDESDVVAGGVVPLVRRVYLIVSDVDQVPEWLDTEKFPQLRVVTHRDMFTAEEAAWVLPTMNSNVIESGMHRIPGISRFILYFNNDMFVGRKVSFFDLFRPLSPARQLLEVADLVHTTTAIPEMVYAVRTSDERVPLFFESVFNSDGYVAPPRRSLWAALAARLVPPSLCAHLADRNATGGWADRTARSLCVPNRFPLPRENMANGLNHIARYRVQAELPGVVPSMEYAHMPRIIDRDVARVMLEDDHDGFGELAKEMRRAYRRSMNGFSPAHVYESYALAARRSRVAALWCQANPMCAATVAALHPRTARQWRRHRDTFCPGHPLDGVSQDVRLQHAELLQRWGTYEAPWLMGTAPTPVTEAGNGTTTALENRTASPTPASATTCVGCTLSPAPNSTPPLFGYEPSDPVKALLSEAVVRAPHLLREEVLTGCRLDKGVVETSRVQSLLLDVHHHVSTDDKTFRFFIVENLQILAIVLTKVESMISADAAAGEHMQNASTAHPGFESSHLPLFLTVNDDLEGDVLRMQLRSSTLTGWNESLVTETLFRRVLWLCSYMAPPAPWERAPA